MQRRYPQEVISVGSWPTKGTISSYGAAADAKVLKTLQGWVRISVGVPTALYPNEEETALDTVQSQFKSEEGYK